MLAHTYIPTKENSISPNSQIQKGHLWCQLAYQSTCRPLPHPHKYLLHFERYVNILALLTYSPTLDFQFMGFPPPATHSPYNLTTPLPSPHHRSALPLLLSWPGLGCWPCSIIFSLNSGLLQMPLLVLS